METSFFVREGFHIIKIFNNVVLPQQVNKDSFVAKKQ
jgi:hypothetical protein